MNSADGLQIENFQAIVAAGITSLVVVAVYFAGRHRDNEERFTADRRSAYSDLVSGLLVLRSIINRDEPRDAAALAKAKQDLLSLGGVSDDTLKLIVDVHLSNAQRTRDHADRVRDRVEAAFGVIMLVAPADVQLQAAAALELPIEDFCSEAGERQIAELVRLMRADLKLSLGAPEVARNAGALQWSPNSLVARRGDGESDRSGAS